MNMNLTTKRMNWKKNFCANYWRNTPLYFKTNQNTFNLMNLLFQPLKPTDTNLQKTVNRYKPIHKQTTFTMKTTTQPRTAYDKTARIAERFNYRGINASFDQINTLRRAELTLQHWYAQECGDGNNYASWAIERDEKTGIPYMVTYPNSGPTKRYKIADREKGARTRIAKICAELGLNYYIQSDPRGCALYVSREALDGSNYTNGIAVCN